MTKETGRAKGGVERARRMTAEERKDVATKAAKARWSGRDIPLADYVGTLKVGELEIPCAVLPDGRRVLSQRGIAATMGRRYGGKDFRQPDDQEESGGGKMPFFLAASTLKSFIDSDLSALVSEPIPYRHGKGGGIAQGVDATLLPNICDVWLRARDSGRLTKPQQVVAQRADLLMRGLAHVGIISLVDEATGYQKDRARDALARILEAFVAKELRPYVKTFPADYYEQLFRLYKLPYPPEGNRSWRPAFFGRITNEVIYSRLAPDLLPELKKAASKAQKRSRLHQWLTVDIGHPKLREHLASIIAIQKLSTTPRQFLDNVNHIHPRYGTTKMLDLDDPGDDAP